MRDAAPLTASEVAVLRRHCEGYVRRFGTLRILGMGDELPLSGRIDRELLSDAARTEREHRGPASTSASAEPEATILASLCRQRRVFVTGDGGTGKTDFTHHLAYLAADTFLEVSNEKPGWWSRTVRWLRRLLCGSAFLMSPDSLAPLIPVHLYLKELRPTNNLLDYAWTRLAGEGAADLPHLRRKLLAGGQLLLIFDGLDELNGDVSPDTFDGLLGDLLESATFGACPLVLAGRKSALTASLGRAFPESASRYELEPLTGAQIDRYIRSHFAARGNSPRGEQLVVAILSNASVNIQAGSVFRVTNENPGPSTTGGTLRIATGALTATGSMEVQGGATVLVNVVGTGAGATTVSGGGKLGGYGSIAGPLSVALGGTVAPGDPAGNPAQANTTTGILGAGDTAINTAMSTLAVKLGGTTPGSQYDRLNVAGTVNVTGGMLSVGYVNSFVPNPTDKFFIVTNDGADPVTGVFATLNGIALVQDPGNPNLYTAMDGFTLYTLNVADNGDAGASPNDISLTVAVPEPAAAGLLALGAIGLLKRRRRIVARD